MTKRKWLWTFLYLLGSLPAVAAELYRWVDEQGRVQVSDRLPPGKMRYTTLDQKGIRLKDVVPPPLAAPADQAAQQAREQQAARLRQLYGSVAEIEAIRDQHLNDLKAHLAFLQAQRARVIDQIAGLKAREAAFEAGKGVPPNLQHQLQLSQEDLAAHERAINQRQQDLERTRAAYEADLAAYRALDAAQPTSSGGLQDGSVSPPPHP